jgi:hypothetical protein
MVIAVVAATGCSTKGINQHPVFLERHMRLTPQLDVLQGTSNNC